jgi:pyruvate-ferredoxin/flavodoxin oxidoreductase
VAGVAYPLSDVIVIYPITPASPIGESTDDWMAAARPNLWGVVPEVIEMQSEAGAAGALHGALQRGAVGTQGPGASCAAQPSATRSTASGLSTPPAG